MPETDEGGGMGRWDALFWWLAAFYLFLGLLCVGGPVLVVALILNASSRPILRRVARVLVAFPAAGLVVLLLVLVPVASDVWRARQRHRAYDAHTSRLATAQVVDGVSFPPGSTVHLNNDGSLDSGTVPVPTRIAGLLLVGTFNTSPRLNAGTLAEPAEVEGIPCAAGKVSWAKGEYVDCTLARGIAVAGHDLAAAAEIAVSTQRSGGREIGAGTLAHPELLFDIVWPAGTVLHRTAAPPERIAHGSAPPGETVSLCVPGSQAVAVPGATLHGKITYLVREAARELYAGCEQHDRPDEHDGYATAGTDRHSRGWQEGPNSPWTWDDYRAAP